MEAQPRTPNHTLQTQSCPVCQSTNIEPVLEVKGVPIISNVIWDNRAEALASPRGDIELAFCANCGHVFNLSFNPRKMEYNVTYENSLHFSPRFQEYAQWLAHHLIDHYDIHNKQIIEIGSGKGDFLKMLCEFGDNHGTGFDPSFKPTPEDQHPAITFVQDVYSDRYAHYQANLICSRHTLEHIDQPGAFISRLRQTVGSDSNVVIFFEVPNLGFILRDTAIWDIIYEHISYFSAHSLANLFERHGFRTLALAEVYEGQFLYIEAQSYTAKQNSSCLTNSTSLDSLKEQVDQFREKSDQKRAYWRQKIDQIQSEKHRAVIWGAGSKGISFLNMLHIQDEVPYAVDINPRKRNKFITGTGQEIIPPEYLKEYQPDTVILINPIYQEEVQQALRQVGIEDVEILSAG